MKFRTYEWLDTNTMKVQYGIQAKRHKTDAWLNVAERGKPLIFTDKENRDAKINELRRGAEGQ